MNKFVFMEGNKPHLELGDMVQWSENKKPSHKLMIFKSFSNTIGLIDMDLATIYMNFKNINELEKYLLKIKVDDNEIFVVNKNDWTVYVP